ncbi:MAG: hypothetical protein RR553_04150 [Akkermansia sp.]
MKALSIKERRARLERELKEARNKATASVSRGNVCLIQGSFVTKKDIEARRAHAADFLKKMR